LAKVGLSGWTQLNFFIQFYELNYSRMPSLEFICDWFVGFWIKVSIANLETIVKRVSFVK
jgi:hypothetical protein